MNAQRFRIDFKDQDGWELVGDVVKASDYDTLERSLRESWASEKRLADRIRALEAALPKPPICNCINCQGKVMERGMFVFDGVHTIQSDDFSHDVSITFNGDMLPDHYERYGEWLTKILNAATDEPT
jgi:hypothetical protein